MSKGFNQSDIAKELHTTRNTIMRDIKEINQWTRKGLYDMAKQSLSTMLYSCLIGLNEVGKEAWKIYRSNGNDKVHALRLLVDICKSKFTMYESGPAVMELNRITGELQRIKKDLEDDNNNKYLPHTYNPNPHTRFEESRKEYKRGLKNLEDFRNLNHNYNSDNSNNDNYSNDSDDVHNHDSDPQ